MLYERGPYPQLKQFLMTSYDRLYWKKKKRGTKICTTKHYINIYLILILHILRCKLHINTCSKVLALNNIQLQQCYGLWPRYFYKAKSRSNYDLILKYFITSPILWCNVYYSSLNQLLYFFIFNNLTCILQNLCNLADCTFIIFATCIFYIHL